MSTKKKNNIKLESFEKIFNKNDEIFEDENDHDVIASHSIPKNITKNREIIRVDQDPTQLAWAFTPLYKESVTGNLLFWQIGFDGVNQLEMSHGYADGIINTDKNEVELNNSGRTMLEQSLLQARNEYRKKIRTGYSPALNTTKALKEPMLAANFIDNKTLAKKPLIFPVILQPKLDGIRLLVSENNGNFFIRSRRNKEYTHLSYLNKELKKLFAFLPNGATLDGELYVHGMTFNQIQSIVMSVKNIDPRLEEIEYHIFDIDYVDPSGAPLEQRIELLINAFKLVKKSSKKGKFKKLVLVESRVGSNYEDIKNTHDYYVEEGYEGLMIKKMANGSEPGDKKYEQSLYKAGRNTNTLKYKEFFDEEAIIVGAKEGKGRNKGVAIFIVKDIRGNTFDLEMRGTIELRKEYLKNIENYIGKEVTFRYIKLNEYGVPVHYKGISIRE